MTSDTKEKEEPGGVSREADDIFVFMGKDFRVSRNARAHWFFDHIDKDVTVEELDFKNEKGTEMSVVGVVPKNGGATEMLIGQKFKVTTETKVVYISRFYRQVYILELSPSIIVADDETDCCLYNKLLECLRTSLESVTKPFTIPGSNSVYEPQIYASIIIFVPFLAFEEDLTIVSGVLLSHDNVDIILAEVDRKWAQIKERLYRFSQPVMRNWAQIRRRHKSRLDSTCVNDSLSTISSVRTAGDNTSSWVKGGLNDIVPDYVIPLCESINAVPKRVFDSTVSGKKRKSTRVEARGEGYIIPELALMFMLRLGLTVVQTMPENTQSNVIIITDGVSGMPAPESLQTILRELRGYTVACSFIEVKGKPICAPCFGHVTSGDLFHFLATATFGGYLPNCLCTITERDLSLPNHYKPLNSFHRALLCWSFQSALQENKHIFESIKAINPGFAELYRQNIDYHVMINTTYISTLKELLYVRLREGFTLKSIELEEGRVQINLSLPFRPLIVLEYGINAQWPVTDEKGPVHVDLAVAGPQDEIRDMKLSKSSECVYRANAMRMHLINSLEDCCRRIAFADRIMLHLHSFNLNSYFYSYPKGINQIPLYFKSYVTLSNGEKCDSILVRKFIPREKKEGFSAFLRFWQEVVNLRQDEWQKWVHVHIERAVLYCQPVGSICIRRNHHERVSCQKAKDVFHKFLLDMNSFCLIEEELYVMLVTKREDGIPSYFYMLRVEQILPYVVLKCAFLGGICSSERRRVVKELRLGLAKLKFKPKEDGQEEYVLTTMKRPLERILIMYEKLPENNYLAQWTSTEAEDDNFDIPLCVENEKHNAVTKYLEGRRHVWHLPLRISDDLEAGHDPCDYQRVRKIADMAVNGLLKRRLSEGFQVAWTKNMIIGLVRQIEVEGRTMLQQYIVFQPVCNRPLDRKDNSRPGFLVVTESWNEPCLFRTTPCSTLQRADDDDDFIVCLYTLKYLLLLTTDTTHTSITVAQQVAQVKNGFHIFPRISYVQNSFNLHTLLKYSCRLLLHLPTFEIGDDASGELRNAVFSTAFYSEFGRYSNAYFDVPDPQVFAMLLTQMFFDKKETRKYNAEQFENQGFDERYLCKCRIFVRGMDMRNCLIMVVPSEDRISEDRRSWPVIVAIGDGALTQDCMAIQECPSKVLEHRMKRMSMSRPDDKHSPTDVDLDHGEVLRVGTDEDINRESSSSMGMRQIVGEIRDAILERATVAALFKCLKLGKGDALDREDVSWILNELCDYTNVELYCVPDAIEKFCEHLKKEKKDTTCCDPSTLQNIFAEVLKFKNFAPIPADPNYYFFNAEAPVPKELVRRNSLLIETNLPVLTLLHPGGRGPAYPVKCRMSNGRKSQKQKQQMDCPLFIFFHCVLQLPNGEEEYVPVNYLPSCVNQVLQSAGKNVPNRDLHKVRIKLLVYVLTWPRQMKDDYDEGIETNPIDFIGRAKKFLSKLPFNERDTIRETISWMNRSLRLESLLVSEKTVDQVTIETVSDFITDIVGKTCGDFPKDAKDANDRNFLAPQIRQQVRSLKFVIPSPNAFETLLKRLDGKTVEYCTLRRVENTKYFYIYRAENKKGFERHLKDHYLRKIRGEEGRPRHDSNSGRSLSRTESESSVFSSSPRMDITSEMELALEKARDSAAHFWIILSIEKTVSPTDCEEIMAKLQFCGRYACEPSQLDIYTKTWQKTRAEIRMINQEILLENMFYTRNCREFLLTKEDKKNMDEEDEEDDSLDLSMAHTANYDFAPGSLACPLVWAYWIMVHPRLRRKSQYGPLQDAAVLLRRSFEQYMVNNVPNTFVFKGEDGYYLYGQIYANIDRFFKSGIQYSSDFEGNVREKAKENVEGEEKYLLFAGFGVSKPPVSLMTLIADGLIEKKLSEQVLESLVDIFKRNPRALLESYDVEFMQPDPRKPATMFYFSIPMIMKKFTSAVLYYQGQHLSCNHIEEARLRDSLQSGSQSRQRPFKSYPTIVIPGEPSNQKYEPVFLLYNRFKEKGSSDFGMAVLEMRIVNEKGMIEKPCDGLIRLESHKSLIPNLDDPNTMFEWFETMTTTYCEEVDPRLQPEQQPKAPTPVPNSCGYIQVIVWQIGDVGLSHLQTILTTIIEASFLDVVTEYGILNTDIVEASAPLIPPPSPSAVTPTKLKTPLSAQKLSSSKKRDSTEAVHLTGIQTPTPLTADATKRGSAVFTYEPIRRGSNHEIMTRDDFILPIPRVSEHLASHFEQFSDQWFEFISMRSDSQFYSFTYRKAEFKLRHSVLVQQTLNQIEDNIRQFVKSADPVLNDRIQVFQNVNKGTNDQPRYDLVTLPLVEEKATDIPPKEHHPRYLMLSYSEDVNRETRRYGYEIAKNQLDAPIALARLADTNKDCKWLYLPNIEENFIPRQTMLIIKEHNNTVTLFTYNFLPNVHDAIANTIFRMVMWQNAKYRLYEHIVEHPLDPVLPPVPEDWRTVDNSYVKLIGLHPDLLLEVNAPVDSLSGMGVPISSEIAQRLFRVRRSYTAQVAHACPVQRAFQQFKEMRKEVKQQVYAYQSNKIMYDNLAEEKNEVAEEQLQTMWGHCRRVHYVQTPVLLSPAWRRKIAQVRRGVNETPVVKPKQLTTTVAQLTSMSRSRAGTLSGALSRQQTLPTKTKEEEELYDPCHVKMLHDLTEEYVEFLGEILQLKLLNVVVLSEKSREQHRYKMEYPQGGRKPPDVCLFKRLMHGILLVRLHFVPPYFIMSVGMWASPELLLRDQTLTERESKEYLGRLEFAKDQVVSKSHMHSFTYDFHLRMISRYLIHKEVLFPNGYNTSTFLVDFLKYYACRPPSARNCVYEERNTFPLNRNINSSTVWTCFLEKHYEEKYNWKVLRIRITDEETDHASTRANEYMLASSVVGTKSDTYSKLCVLLRDRRKKEADGSISLAQYVILVDPNRHRPLEESRQREDSSKSNVGEFRNVLAPTEEQLNKEVNDMLALIEEGGMPTVEGTVTRRRRFSSGSHTPPMQTKSGDTESGLHSPVLLHGSESDTNVPVQGDPTLRHRKHGAGSNDEGEIPGEKASYIQYISNGQRKLQLLLEDTTNEYSDIIKNAVDEANRECLREFLWNSVTKMLNNAPPLSRLGSQVRLGSSAEIWNSLRNIQHPDGQHIIELCDLVERESMKDREQRLKELVATANCARLCRFLVYYFGSLRCRVFESAQSKTSNRSDVSPDLVLGQSVLRHLLIINPDNPIVFLVRCEEETSPDLIILFKKSISQSSQDSSKKHFTSLLDKAFDEIVQSVTAFVWSDLIYRPPGKST